LRTDKESFVKAYAYRAKFEAGDRRGTIVASFPDVPEAITQGRGEADARAMAEEALGLALLSYLQRGKLLPKPRAKARGLVEVAVAPDVAAKLAALESFAAAGITKSELARRIGKDEKEVRRILDPRHPTKLPALTAALRALGKRLVVGVVEAEAA
jgi:antitoxin HicB